MMVSNTWYLETRYSPSTSKTPQLPPTLKYVFLKRKGRLFELYPRHRQNVHIRAHGITDSALILLRYFASVFVRFWRQVWIAKLTEMTMFVWSFQLWQFRVVSGYRRNIGYSRIDCRAGVFALLVTLPCPYPVGDSSLSLPCGGLCFVPYPAMGPIIKDMKIICTWTARE